MKNFVSIPTLILINLFQTFVLSSQTDCGKDLEKFAYDTYSISKSEDTYSSFSSFFNMDSETQKRYIAASNSETGITALIKAVYLSYNKTEVSTEDKSEYERIKKQFQETQVYSQKSMQTLYARVVNKEAIKAYRACLEGGKSVQISIEGDQKDEFIVTLEWVPKTTEEYGKSKTISVNLVGMIPIGSTGIYNGAIISAGYRLMQTYKRKDKYSRATITIDINGIGKQSKDLDEEEKEIFGDIPLGTIIASTFNFEKFKSMYMNGSLDLTKSKWAPCDGRNVQGSKYGNEIASVPDLRGIFLRGLNKFDGNENSAVNADRMDPEGTRSVGSYQADELRSHRHGVGGGGTGNGPNTGYGSDNSYTSAPYGGAETRPKNVAVYYYIRIN